MCKIPKTAALPNHRAKMAYRKKMAYFNTVSKWKKFHLGWRVKFRWENHHSPPPPLQEKQICFKLRKFLIFVVDFLSTRMRIKTVWTTLTTLLSL